VQATSVIGPPSANAEAASEDLFYQLPTLPDGGEPEFRPRQRVSLHVPLKGEEDALVVPWSSVLFDAYGGTWVYGEVAAGKYARRKVQVRRVTDRWAVLERGLSEGERIVTVGAAELFGTEFGAGK
jgi:multidrug efflux pump subunit AcrA (membrane-fusion protein)